MRIRLLSIVFLLCPCPIEIAHGQLVSDTLFAWQGYGRTSTCRVRHFLSGADQKKPHTVVVDELAENEGASTLEDAPHLVELAGRGLGIDPQDAFWVFHWGGFSHAGASASDKEFFLRATFRRSDTGSLGSPFWRLISRATVIEYTDRAYR